MAMGMFSPYGFRALENQNAADTQAANVAPTMPGYAGIDKLDFAQMCTPEDQIHWLYLYTLNLDMKAIDETQAQAIVDASYEAMKAYVDEQDGIISADISAKYGYLLKLIEQLEEFPGVVFDPTWGSVRPIKMVTERVYDFDRVFASPAAEYDAKMLTAGEYDAMATEAREYDVMFAAITYGGANE